MNLLLEKMGLIFDENDNTTITKQALLKLIQTAKSVSIFSEYEAYPVECNVLVSNHFGEFYPFPKAELKEWEKDGSCEKGEALYEMKLIKQY